MLSAARFATRFLSALCLCVPVGAQFPGAIFATDAHGQLASQNTFANALDVYVSGGPAFGNPCGSTGLPDGDYYFQVTALATPILYTTDAIENRRVTVVNGVFASYTGTRLIAPGRCSSIIVQLAPFAPCPGNGGQFKIWATRVGNYDPGLSGIFGFRPTLSWISPTFVVTGSGCGPQHTTITGSKFYDFNANGVWDAIPEEVPIPGWRIELWKNGVEDGVVFTDAAGGFQFVRDQDGASYEVRDLPPPPGYVPNVGALWHPTTTLVRNLLANASAIDVGDFGAVSFTTEPTTGLGTSHGFWHNSGRPILQACDPDWRVAVNGPPGFPMCLRRPISSMDPAVSIFTVGLPPITFTTAFFHLDNYLTSKARGHAGYILSVQVCAALLNRACGPFSDYSLIAVDVRNDGRLILLSDLFAGVRVLLCDPRAGMTGPGQNEDLRALMFGCINEFEQLNSESGGSVHTPTTTPQSFSTPYGRIE